MPLFGSSKSKTQASGSASADENSFQAYTALRRKCVNKYGRQFLSGPIYGSDQRERCEKIFLKNKALVWHAMPSLVDVFNKYYNLIEIYESRILGAGVNDSCILEYMYVTSQYAAQNSNLYRRIREQRKNNFAEEQMKREQQRNATLESERNYQKKAIAYIWAAGSLSQNNPHGNFSSRRTISKLKELNPKSEMRFDYFSDDKVYLKYAIEEYDNKTISYMFEELERYVTTNRVQTSILYRGMPSRYIPRVGEIYQPQRFFAASQSINTATRFAPDSGGTILEITGRAAFIPNIYYNGDESEYLFSRNSRFRVTQGQSGNIKLIQI